jgi:hypothetical protein
MFLQGRVGRDGSSRNAGGHVLSCTTLWSVGRSLNWGADATRRNLNAQSTIKVSVGYRFYYAQPGSFAEDIEERVFAAIRQVMKSVRRSSSFSAFERGEPAVTPDSGPRLPGRSHVVESTWRMQLAPAGE